MAIKPSVTVLCVGKRAEPFAESGAGHYAVLCRAWCDVSIIRLRDRNSEPMKTQVRKETDAAIEALEGFTGRVVLLTPAGRSLDSLAFASFVEESVHSNGKLLFLIGGINGFAPDILKHVHSAISLSALTFNHHVALVVLAEQIYRALSIARHTAYHR
ncbi:MAG: hypothetical protein A2350_04650 [Candidatus Raymondbacteria bacterium RifOxyB12_full_50_8]|uniref:Ribosomal RNA large subunit methyltransferase H n=1 Tax=Candidatus Raymondbacteria bacterium RIFOXYD12_FULL_49_13 TaxID=1817890 RepID=A0A1F7F6E4_UNCRA|nr:MAG: hypothetical protein A2248_13210 [Candidatus Raymondbacteria bacterium RIFOXYA2_FULL_49_16]OGJ96056.1 MAG: hypothetical protein A2350_04650 [Candidatus Raymondbacteria bacterium RifOxyB12_full_50_8]OGK02245.1 MAG: hypothetical protein A2519_16325 [Candidatus Raymondbacteria bacterium RIFOXYD12_FULL_49_13]OGP45142.1 MAG: hypothetical protein A2324_12145 [Candidatus Raymondbacteria bacterium RIFOXYB2_FULL_49_35]